MYDSQFAIHCSHHAPRDAEPPESSPSHNMPHCAWHRVLRRSYLALFALAALTFIHASAARAAVAGFDDLPLPLHSFHNGDPGDLSPGESHDGSFLSGDATFNNLFEVAQFGENVFKLWSGWSFSNVTDNTTAGFTNQHSAIAGQGAGGSDNYGVAFLGGTTAPTISLPSWASVQSVRVTNATYAYLAMVNGDDAGAGFVRKFGDDPNVPGAGNQGHPDFLLLDIIGRDALGEPTGTVPVYLADYRFADNVDDFAVNNWELIDLTPLGSETRALDFLLTSSDSGPFGINTPNYFALDDLTYTDPPTVLGDTNGDGVVNIDDLNNVRANFGANGMPVLGDTNGDLRVDVDDLNNVRNNFGATAGQLAGVPEPAGLLMLLSAVTVWAASNGRRHSRRAAEMLKGA